MVDLAVPFCPRTSTPPTSGEIVVRRRARAISPKGPSGSSAPTTAQKGYCCGMGGSRSSAIG